MVAAGTSLHLGGADGEAAAVAALGALEASGVTAADLAPVGRRNFFHTYTGALVVFAAPEPSP